MKLSIIQKYAEYYSLYYATNNARKYGNVLHIIREGNFISLYFHGERVKRLSGKSTARHIDLVIRDICDYLNENAELYYKMVGLSELFLQNKHQGVIIQYHKATEAFHKHCDQAPWRIKL